jgi:hypothetical protein
VRGKALACGQSLQEERPDEFFEEVSAFLAEASPGENTCDTADH